MVRRQQGNCNDVRLFLDGSDARFVKALLARITQADHRRHRAGKTRTLMPGLVSSGESRVKGYRIVNRKISTAIWPLLIAAAILCAIAPAKAAEKKPNIVFMLMDNLGYGELGVYGGGILRGAPTP